MTEPELKARMALAARAALASWLRDPNPLAHRRSTITVYDEAAERTFTCKVREVARESAA